MKRHLFACLAVLGSAAAAAAGPRVFIFQEKTLFRGDLAGNGYNSGVSVSGLQGNVVGLASLNGRFYATASDGWLYEVHNINSNTVSATREFNIGAATSISSNTITFEFFGNTFRGLAGGNLIQFDIDGSNNVSNFDDSVAHGAGGNNPSSGRIGNDLFALNGSTGAVSKITNFATGATTAVGDLGFGSGIGAEIAGGSGFNGVYYTGLRKEGSESFVRFGRIDQTTGNFTTDFTFNPGFNSNTMGVHVTIIPLPTGAGLAFAGLGMIAVRRRR